jgi:hypothetical protein
MLIYLERKDMKRFSKYLLGLSLLSLVLSAVPGHAQDSDRVNVTIPFDFVVGAKQLKAGDYVIESLPDRRGLILRSRGGDIHQIAFTTPIETNRTGSHERLLFHRDGEQYFLSQVWFRGDEEGRELSLGVNQERLAKSRPVSDQAIVGQ